MRVRCNRIKIIAFVFLFLFLARPSLAAVWVGGSIGPNFSQGDYHFKIFDTRPESSCEMKTNASPSFMGGLTVGYDFVNRGFLGAPWPSWMKYFGLAIDLSFTSTTYNPKVSLLGDPMPTVSGHQVSLGFLLIAKYPIDKLIPYVGVGPAINWSTLDFSIYGANSSTAVSLGFLTETGFRYMITPHFSADLAYRFSYCKPINKLDFPINWPINRVELSPGGLKNHNILMRFSYHF